MDEIDTMREKMKPTKRKKVNSLNNLLMAKYHYQTSSRPQINWDKLAKKASLLLVVVGTMFFMLGVHNVDNAWNIRTIEIDTGNVYVDTTLLGSQHGASDLYNMGILYEFMGFIITAGALIEYLSLEMRR